MKTYKNMLMAIGLYFIFTQPVYAKARFMQLEELAAVSDVIAVIEVLRSEKIWEATNTKLPKKGYWRYAQKNYFKFIEFIKVQKEMQPDIVKTQILWAEKSFKCARASYKKGRYLVFLENVGENEWITLNHGRGGLAIDEKNGVVQFGFYKPESKTKTKTKMDLLNAKKIIAEAMLDKEKVSFYAKVDRVFKSVYNIWRENSPFQKLWFHIEESIWIDGKYTKTEIEGKWPENLSLFVRGFIPTEDIRRIPFEKLIDEGGTFKITGGWNQGYLYLESIQNIETKEKILK